MGQVAELAVAYDLSQRGYSISWPLSNVEHDLIASRQDEVLRVQVKSLKQRVRNGRIYYVLDCTDGLGRRYRPGTVDMFAAYNARDKNVTYVSFDELNGARERWFKREEEKSVDSETSGTGAEGTPQIE